MRTLTINIPDEYTGTLEPTSGKHISCVIYKNKMIAFAFGPTPEDAESRADILVAALNIFDSSLGKPQ